MNQLGALGLSLVVEVPVALGLLRGVLPRKELGHAALSALAATLLTHPVAWNSILFLMKRIPYAAATTGVELAVVGVEAVLYASVLGVAWRRALLVSAVANAASVAVGFAFWILVPR